MKSTFLSFVLMCIAAQTPADADVVGVWESKAPVSGNLYRLNFKRDGTFISHVNKKAFTSGQYTYKNGLISFVEDNACTDSTGAKTRAIAKLVFFATNSFRIDVINDNCTDRRKAVHGSRYGRVKKAINDDILGQWQGKLPNNVIATMHYKKDSTVDVFLNKKIFASGKYTYADNVLTLVEDNGCINKDGAYLKGAYKINFFASDSIQYEAIYDSCSGRKRDLNHLKMGKVEKSKPE